MLRMPRLNSIRVVNKFPLVVYDGRVSMSFLAGSTAS